MFMRTSSGRIPTSVHVDMHGLRIEDGANTFDVALDRIDRIEVYKQDMLVADLVCLDVWIDDRVFLIHEEMKGWDDAVRRLEDLQDFDKQWFSKVSKPAFAENRTVIYERKR